MTNQEQPDTRPRCGGEPGKPGRMCACDPPDLPSCWCLGCPDCAPAPDTQSGGRPTAHALERERNDANGSLAKLITNDGRRLLTMPEMEAMVRLMRAVQAETRSESAAALQEARDRNKVLLAVTESWEEYHRIASARADRDESEATALREQVEGLRTAVEAAIATCEPRGIYDGNSNTYSETVTVISDGALAALRALALARPAATRPVPAVSEEK